MIVDKKLLGRYEERIVPVRIYLVASQFYVALHYDNFIIHKVRVNQDPRQLERLAQGIKFNLN